jgi:hypothetical protein
LQNGLEKKVEKSRKQKKERRNRARKVRGAKKNAGGELAAATPPARWCCFCAVGWLLLSYGEVVWELVNPAT